MFIPLAAAMKIGFYAYAAAMAAVVLAALLGARGSPLAAAAPLGRLLRGAYASAALLGEPLQAVLAVLGLGLHVSLATLAVAHMIILGSQGGAGLYTLSPEAFIQLLRIVDYSAAAVGTLAAVLTAARITAAARGYPLRICATIGDVLLAIIGLSTWLGLVSMEEHVLLGLAGLGYTLYLSASGHMSLGPRLLRNRVLRV